MFPRAAMIHCGVLALAGALALCGCAAADPDAAPAAEPAGASTVVPEPGRTIEATPPGTAPAMTGYRIAVVHPPTAEANRLLQGVLALADDAGASIQTYDAASTAESDVAQALSDATADQPDLVVGVGADVVDTFSYDTAQMLDQQFLLIGAQLAEPTQNVTAVIWEGATSRGSAAAPDADLSSESATVEVAERATASGMASIRDGVTGVVLHLSSP